MAGAIGGLFDMVGALGKYSVSQSLAREQMMRSQKLRNEASNVKAPTLRKEFRDVEKMKALQTMLGLPGYNAYKDEIGSAGATSLRAGREGATSGADYLTYASSVYNDQQKQERDLKVQNTTYRAGAFGDYAKTLWAVGTEEKQNEEIQRKEKEALMKQASALEDASTANKYQGKTDAIGGVTSAAGSIAGGLSGGGGMGGGNTGGGKTSGNTGGASGGSGKTSGGFAGGQSYQGTAPLDSGSGKTSTDGLSDQETNYLNMLIEGGGMSYEQALQATMKKFRQ